RGGSFATASTHASCQCLAITRPPVTRQPGPSKSAGGSDDTAALALTSSSGSGSRSVAAPVVRGRQSTRRRVAGWSRIGGRREAPRGIVPEKLGCPEGRQLRDSIYACVLPVPCHHAATSDTPTRYQGRGQIGRAPHSVSVRRSQAGG